MKEIFINNLDLLLGTAIATGAAFFVWLYKNPEKGSVFINLILLAPLRRYAVKYKNPQEHPIFSQIVRYRDHQCRSQQFEHPMKQAVWRIYSFTFYRVMHKQLTQLCASEVKSLSEEGFEKLMKDSFTQAISKFMEQVEKKIHLPAPVWKKLRRFEEREIESFYFVIEVWKNDNRFSGLQDPNSVQLYNILNDLQSRFHDFWTSSLDFFIDFNGLLEREARIKNKSDDNLI